jgi:hypothetical protein
LFFGLSSISNEDESKKEFGIAYGGTYVFTLYGLNLTISAGLENGFSTSSQAFKPFIGFGAGFKILDLAGPDNPNE